MARPFNAIVPPTYQRSLSGFIGAGERTVRGKLLRVEWWNGQPAKFMRDGKNVEIDIHADKSAAALMMDSYNFFLKAG